jgi:hypothetical protein
LVPAGVVAIATDPCANTKFITDKSRAAFDKRISTAERQSIDQANAVIKTSLDATFNEAKRGVDPFLDWYFSLAGDKDRFMAVMADESKDVLAERIETQVLAPLQGLELSISKTVEESVQPIFGGAFRKIQEDLDVQMSEQACLRFELRPLELTVARDKIRWSLSAAIGAGLGGVMARRAAVNSASGVIERAGVRAAGRAAVELLKRQKKKLLPPVVVGRTLCNLTGWMRWLCRIAVSAGGAVIVEVLSLELDEVLHRDEMRQKIIADLDQQRAALEVELVGQAERVIRSQVITLRADVNQKVFVPARDGV